MLVLKLSSLYVCLGCKHSFEKVCRDLARRQRGVAGCHLPSPTNRYDIRALD